MTEVSNYSWQELVDTFPWDDETYKAVGMARIEGVIDGQRWAALVPKVLAEDETVAKAHLAYLARVTPVTPLDGIEVIG